MRDAVYWLGYAVILAGGVYVEGFYRLTHPDRTETQLFLDNLVLIGVLVVVALGVGVLSTDWGKRRG